MIGVANVFLKALFYDVKLDYQVPIISQQGEVRRSVWCSVKLFGGGDAIMRASRDAVVPSW